MILPTENCIIENTNPEIAQWLYGNGYRTLLNNPIITDKRVTGYYVYHKAKKVGYEIGSIEDNIFGLPIYNPYQEPVLSNEKILGMFLRKKRILTKFVSSIPREEKYETTVYYSLAHVLRNTPNHEKYKISWDKLCEEFNLTGFIVTKKFYQLYKDGKI